MTKSSLVKKHAADLLEEIGPLIKADNPGGLGVYIDDYKLQPTIERYMLQLLVEVL